MCGCSRSSSSREGRNETTLNRPSYIHKRHPGDTTQASVVFCACFLLQSPLAQRVVVGYPLSRKACNPVV